MGLSTHVLDTMHGTPAGGMAVALFRIQQGSGAGAGADGQAELVKRFTLDPNGRNPDGLLYGHDELRSGRYRLSFEVRAYFAARGVALPEPAFLDVVHIDFGVAEPSQHYHVPLLVSPWSYSTYRGS